MPSRKARTSVDTVDEVRYLAATANTQRYRLIMRFFYEQHRLHVYALTPEQVQAHVAAIIADYGQTECQQDLEVLVGWGNLLQDWELGLASVRTIEDFRRRNVLYSATPDALAIEELMVSLETQREQVGQLDGTAIGRLLDDVRRFAVTVAATAVEPPRVDHATWDDVWRRFAQIADDANDYMSDMRSQERERLFDLAAFQVYKDSLINYLSQFIDGLVQAQPTIHELVRRWDASDLAVRLATAAKEGPRSFESLAVLTSGYQAQIMAVQDWFRPGGSADKLRAFASRAVERISLAARRLSDARRGLASRAQDLLALADLFSTCDDEAADRVAGLVFGLSQPRQWERDLPDTVSEQPGLSAWECEPVSVPIRQRRSNVARRGDAGRLLADQERRKAELRAAARIAEQAAIEVLTRLFAAGEVRLGALARTDPEEAGYLLQLVYECISAAPGYSVQAPDGSMIKLANPVEASYVWLTSVAGRMLVPDYRLIRLPGLREVGD